MFSHLFIYYLNTQVRQNRSPGLQGNQTARSRNPRPESALPDRLPGNHGGHRSAPPLHVRLRAAHRAAGQEVAVLALRRRALRDHRLQGAQSRDRESGQPLLDALELGGQAVLPSADIQVGACAHDRQALHAAAAATTTTAKSTIPATTADTTRPLGACFDDRKCSAHSQSGQFDLATSARRICCQHVRHDQKFVDLLFFCQIQLNMCMTWFILLKCIAK